MSNEAYKLLGRAAWWGGKWYLRQRLPAPRKVLLASAVTGLAAGAAVLLARRAGA